jgi:hypothetical protein
MGRHPQHVSSRVGGRGRHRALRCHGVALRARRQVRAVPDLQQRTLALRTAPRSDRSGLPSHVRRPYAGSKDAAVTARSSENSCQRNHHMRKEGNMSRKLGPLAALAMVALFDLRPRPHRRSPRRPLRRVVRAPPSRQRTGDGGPRNRCDPNPRLARASRNAHLACFCP